MRVLTWIFAAVKPKELMKIARNIYVNNVAEMPKALKAYRHIATQPALLRAAQIAPEAYQLAALILQALRQMRLVS
jgi:hypothetical protein